ncbi:hypothetical protein [Streptomyces sp. NPDC058308]
MPRAKQEPAPEGEAGAGPEPRLGYLTDDDFGTPHGPAGELPVRAGQ